ncbi:putative aminoacrylate hydrolase RutD isoform X2 [Macadamia integrifolia]|uniref:putative aminoacrylate hydrolase RutD isoform X2 n=1 Tax=Macadamia integrifolia TaxID=60698 RepID=UPI001C4E4D6C|nr:putative aminoacrylate hydrolase RutD isoform X2 [Macadamia integrifolia]
MAVNRKISAASARAHTRKSKQNSSFQLPSGLFKKISVVLLIGFLAWAYQAIQPPPPKICGSPGGPPVTAPRIKLRDGRHLAYRENGVPRLKAKYKIIWVHGIESCRHDVMQLSPEITEDLGIYLLSFDRDGYGESDPNPKRTVKSTALDIEELADQLGLRSKFYVIGHSMGGAVAWTCLKYIPHRLAGVALLAPVVNFWWPGLPTNLTKEAYEQQLLQDQWTVRVAHYTPWLTYWWNTQRWFPASSILAHSPEVLSRQDKECMPKFARRNEYMAQVRQQGEFDCVFRDLNFGFGNWEFDPMKLENPFRDDEGSVHLWQGDEDRLVPVTLQRYVAGKLPWIHYHELPGSGHMFSCIDSINDAIVKALLLGEK